MSSVARRLLVAGLACALVLLAGVSSAGAARYVDVVNGTSGVTGYWRLSDLSGTTAAAQKGPAGTYGNLPALGLPGLLRTDSDLAAGFGGNTGRHVAVADGVHADFASAYTLEAWVRVDAAAPGTTNYVICKNGAYALRLNAAGDWEGVAVRSDNAWQYVDSNPEDRPVVGTTYHVVATFDGAYQRIYVNGELADREPATGPIMNTSQALGIGGCPNFDTFDGTIDEPAVYSVALSAAQVRDHYESGADVTPPAPPTDLKLTAGDTEVEVEWRGSSSADAWAYTIHRLNTSNGTVATSLDSDDYEIQRGLTNGTTYEYWLTATDTHGNVSAPTAHVTVTPVASTRYTNLIVNDPGVQSYHRLDDSAGTIARATVGDDGTLAGSPTLGSTWLIRRDRNPGIVFDGVDDQVTVPDSERLDASNAVSFEAWVRPSARTTGNANIIAKPGAYVLALRSDGMPEARVYAAGTTNVAVGATPLALSTTYHVVGTFDGQRIRLYVNGAPAADVALTGKITENANALQIGAHASSARFKGSIDEPAVYDTVLSAERIATHYAFGDFNKYPVAPSGVTASAGDGIVALDWADNAEANVTGYNVLRKVPGGAWTRLNRSPVPTSRYTDTTAANGVAYAYWIKAVNSTGLVGPESVAVNATPRAASGYRTAVTNTGTTRGYWRLGEGRGGVAAAEVGPEADYNNHPELGRPGLIRAELNTNLAPRFSTNRYVSVPLTTALDVSSAFTLEAWVRPDSAPATTRHILCKSGAYGLRLSAANDLQAVLVRTDGTTVVQNAATKPAVGSTYHVAATYDGAALRIYVNGALSGSQAATGLAATTASRLGVASCDGTDTWDGIVDEPAVYGTPLSAAQLKDHYDLGVDSSAPAPPSSLTATPGDRQVALDWADSTAADFAYYEVHRSDTLDGANWAAPRVSERLTTSSFADTDLENGKAKHYIVKAYDKAGMPSGDSAKVSATPTAGTVLFEPETLHANGADLEWARFAAAGETFSGYVVERVYNGATTTLATITDPATTRFRDTTAGPDRSVTYRLKANGAAAGSWTVNLPPGGTARKSLQLDGSSGAATYLREASCANRGADSAIRVGTAGNRVRGLISFDLADIPADAVISSATMSLYAQSPTTAGITVEARRAAAGWAEGTGRGTCTGDGADWTQRREGGTWASPGGDSEAEVVASATRVAGAAAGWDAFDVTSAVRSWAGGTTANSGLLLRAADETAVEGKLVAYASDEAADPGLRPKLTVTYTEPGVAAQAPVVALSSHADGDVVSGSAVKLAAEATDDSKVAKVDFLVDGAVKSTDTSAPFEYTGWNTTPLTAGAHTVVARATDDAGNATSAPTATVTVDNTPAPTGDVDLPAPSYANAVKADNPLAFHRFGEAAGATVAQDSSGNGRHAAYVQTVHLGQPGLTRDSDTAAKIPSAVTGYIESSALGTGVASPDKISVELWHDFKGLAQPGTYDHLIERGWRGDWSDPGRWIVFTTDWGSDHDHVCFTLASNDPNDRQHGACGRIEPGRQHIAASYDGTTIRLMVNGVEVDSRRSPGITLNTTEPVRLGWDMTQDLLVDDLSIYGSALSPEQAQRHYDAAGRDKPYLDAVKADGPVGLWRLGEASGTTGADASGNGRTATYSGNARLGQPGLVGDGSTDAAAVFADDAAGDGKATVTGLNGLAGTNLTAEAWIDTAGPTEPGERQPILSRGWGAAGGWRLALLQTTSGNGYYELEFSIDAGGGSIATTKAVVEPGRLHVAATYDGALRVYVNGWGASEDYWHNLPLTTTAPLVIGDGLGSGEIAIDEAAVFDKALINPKIRQHYAAGRAPALSGAPTVVADTSGTVREVDFYVDGQKFGTDADGAPYDAPLPTLGTSGVDPTYDGTHAITTKVYGTNGEVTTSAPVNVDVGNTAPSEEAIITSSPVPPVMTYDPAAVAQEAHAVDVAVQNTGDATITPTNTTLRARWIAPDGTTTDAPIDTSLSGTAAPAEMVTTRVSVKPPAIPDTRDKAEYRLQFDLVDKSTGRSFAAAGNRPAQKRVVVNQKDAIGLGLERYYHYDGAELGAGVQHLVNLASSNSVLRWTPFDAPGRGLSTVVDLTYNSLEDHSRSPAGNNFSLVASGLTRFGSALDIHPNDADRKVNSNSKWVELTDADGTTHRFTGKTATDGVSVYYEEPAGVNLYLRPTGGSDPARRWAVTRPDRTTFYFDGDGFPTSVEDKNGNRITYVLQATPPGEDPGGPKKRITAVRDAGGRSFTVQYYSKSDVKKAHVRGKISRVTDHSGSALDFEYYEDGNLRRLIQRGGTSDGLTVPDRRITFTYTTSNGAGPAIPAAADRKNPEPRTPNQSTRLFSVIDPMGGETTFAYLGPGYGQDRWRLKSRTDRLSRTTTFSWDGATRTATVARPANRTSRYGFDSVGKISAITNARNETTNVTWTGDRKVERVTEPLNPETGKRAYVEFAYDQNGYVTDQWNEKREKTELRYTYPAADANDVTGKWTTGRTQGHVSQLLTKTEPKGVATASPTTDHQWLFGHDAKGNVTSVADPEQRKLGKAQTVTYDASGNGDVRLATDANGHQTKYDAYDANGLATTITDPLNRVTKMLYNADGLLTSVQDPMHASYTGGTPAHYRSQFYYDAFHRLGRQSAPKSTAKLPGTLIWTGASFDLNDNLTKEVGPHLGAQFTGGDATTGIVTHTYDAMDRERTEVGPDANPAPGTTTPLISDKTSFDYDDADRLQKIVTPKGNLTAQADDYTRLLDYDELDRIVREKTHDFTTGTQKTKTTHYCYDAVGNLRSITAPRANVASVTCSPYAGVSFTTKLTYDDAHRQLTQTDPEGRRTEVDYDANGNLWHTTDANNAGKTATTGLRQSTFKYDERDLPIEQSVPLDDGTRNIISQTRYDAEGNRIKSVSPRGYDAATDKANITEFVTTYEYDDADQMVKQTQPRKTGETPTYIHHRFDANGNPTEQSLPTTTDLNWRTAPTLSAIDAKVKTTNTYFDPGWVRTTDAPGRPTSTFDYTPEGWQASRRTPTRTVEWSYAKDGELLFTQRDDKEASKKDTYTYDANNNLLTAANTISADTAIEKSINITAAYDGFDRPSSIAQRKEGQNRRLTEMSYDLNDNVVELLQNKELDGAGAVSKKARRELFTFDTADWVQRQVDEGKDRDRNTSDDREILTSFTLTGWEKQRKINKFTSADASGTPTFGQLKQQTDWTYFQNGKLKTLVTKNGSGAVKESHDVEYLSNGVYVNGHRVKDTFILNGPAKSGAKCRGDNANGIKCATRHTYDGRDRLIQEDVDRVGASDATTSTKTTKYTLDALGNITDQEGPSNDANLLKTAPGATEKVHFDYSGTRLTKQTATVTANGSSSTSTVYSWYDAEGNLSCTTKGDNQSDLCKKETTSHNASVLTHQSYDSLDRLLKHKSWKFSGAKDREASYVYDALDRVAQQTQQHGSTTSSTGDGPGDPRTTLFTYLGVTQQVTEERDVNPGSSQATRAVRDFAYDPAGNRIGMTKTDFSSTGTQSSEEFTYGYDVHGSVSLLIDSAGEAKARYGYSAYGECDNELTNEPNKTETADTAKAECEDSSAAGTDTDPVNPYRYSAKRADTGSGTIDMGARRFSPDSGRFLQEDIYEDALGDLELGDDPLTANRYSLAGGNPVSFVEVDGHMLMRDGGGGSSRPSSPRRTSRSRTVRRRSPSQSSQPVRPRGATGSTVFNTPIGSTTNRRWNAANERAEAQIAAEEAAEGDKKEQSGFMKFVHGTLDAAGYIPGVGAAPDLINAGIYAAEGNMKEAAWSAGGAIPIAGDGAKAARTGRKIFNRARKSPSQIQRNARNGNRAADRIAAQIPGARREVHVRTRHGSRYVDVMTDYGSAIESKAGRTSLTKDVRKQIRKDVAMRNDPNTPVNDLEWRFSTSPDTGQIGPTPALERELQRNGIRITYDP